MLYIFYILYICTYFQTYYIPALRCDVNKIYGKSCVSVSVQCLAHNQTIRKQEEETQTHRQKRKANNPIIIIMALWRKTNTLSRGGGS